MSSEEHATGPYPGPDESSPYPQTLSWGSILILCSDRRLGTPCHSSGG
jgi:hypothetical protein